MKPNIEELRKKYMVHPPEGFTSEDIRNMSEDELLDMDYFLNEDDLFSDEAVLGCISGSRVHNAKSVCVRFLVNSSYYFVCRMYGKNS